MKTTIKRGNNINDHIITEITADNEFVTYKIYMFKTINDVKFGIECEIIKTEKI